mmetsp:Transcript_14739/g.32714  ORF Transcript_14739/g.32714 Transcript_14739/m.32714 type:complete len:372 (+) Transcript_14739:755-1870(+)
MDLRQRTKHGDNAKIVQCRLALDRLRVGARRTLNVFSKLTSQVDGEERCDGRCVSAPAQFVAAWGVDHDVFVLEQVRREGVRCIRCCGLPGRGREIRGILRVHSTGNRVLEFRCLAGFVIRDAQKHDSVILGQSSGDFHREDLINNGGNTGHRIRRHNVERPDVNDERGWLGLCCAPAHTILTLPIHHNSGEGHKRDQPPGVGVNPRVHRGCSAASAAHIRALTSSRAARLVATNDENARRVSQSSTLQRQRRWLVFGAEEHASNLRTLCNDLTGIRVIQRMVRGGLGSPAHSEATSLGKIEVLVREARKPGFCIRLRWGPRSFGVHGGVGFESAARRHPGVQKVSAGLAAIALIMIHQIDAVRSLQRNTS